MNPAQKPDYNQYSFPDFVLDDSFRRWVFEPDEQRMTFWHGVMLRHPEQKGLIDDPASRHFTGNLSNQSIETLLTTLSLTFDLTVQRNGDRISLRHNP